MAAEGRRAANVSASEKSLLVELVGKYAAVIENKETDKVTVAEKTAAWKLLADEFNAVSSVKRSSEQLKQAYNNVKKSSKKMAAKERMDRFQTGGGPVETVTTDLDAKVLALLGNSAKPLENRYDSDAQCTISSASAAEVASSSAQPVLLLEVDSVFPDGFQDMETLLTDDHCTAPVRGPSSAAAASTLSSSASTEQCRQALLPTSADPLLSFTVPTAPSSARAAVPSKKWAGRRHPRPSSSSSVATADAAAKISAMAASEQAYYAAKLEMDKKEHEVRMRILLLQEEFEVKRLKKMEE